ncbi:MAG TPA: chromate transporter [Stellaceae bacterium]
MQAASNSNERVALGALFFGFLQVGLSAFGGGLVWLHRLVVERRSWLDDGEFAELLSFCQLMPGPNIAGLTVCIGSKLRGLSGALAALSGYLVMPWAVGLGLGTLYLHYADIAVLGHILGGVSAAAAGLVIATGLRLLAGRGRRSADLVFAALAFCGITFVHLPLFLVLAGLAPLGIAAAAFASHRTR